MIVLTASMMLVEIIACTVYGSMALVADGLALFSFLIGWESLVRLTQPIHIDFEQAIAVAAVGLAVNLVCAWLLKDNHAHYKALLTHIHELSHVTIEVQRGAA